MQIVSPGLARIATGFVNVYFIGDPDGSWGVVDAGLPGYAATIIEKAERRFGRKSRPVGIFLTHGHVDHTGNAQALADYWGVPIYAHRLEMPYLTGRSEYPPPDPTVGGAMALVSRFLPSTVRNFGTRMRAFVADQTSATDVMQEEGELPGIEGWKWLATRGHAPGHVSFHRASDRTLVAGDAIATVNMKAYLALLTKPHEIAMAGEPIICDWDAAEGSVRRLAALRPWTLACGHGVPMQGEEVAADLERFSSAIVRPAAGRYVNEPARTDERGVDWLPPKPADPLPWMVLAAVVGLTLALMLYPRQKR